MIQLEIKSLPLPSSFLPFFEDERLLFFPHSLFHDPIFPSRIIRRNFKKHAGGFAAIDIRQAIGGFPMTWIDLFCERVDLQFGEYHCSEIMVNDCSFSMATAAVMCTSAERTKNLQNIFDFSWEM